MKYQLFGRSGLRVSPLCLGTMTFGKDWGWGSDAATAKEIYDAFMEAGGNFIDTADVYTEGSSERILADLISADRDHVVLATKYTLSNTTHNPNNSGNHRKNLVQSVEQSLRRLNTDYIDLLWVHAYDYLTPIDEMMRALDDLVAQGKILYIGISDAPAWVTARANTIAEFRGWSRFIGNQLEYNLTERTPERDLLPMSKELGLGVVAWSPLAAGILTGKYNKDNGKGSGGRMEGTTSYRLNERNYNIAATVVEIAKSLDISPAQVALAWISQQGHIPIIGARTLNQLKDNMGSLDVTISAEQMQQLNEVSSIDLGFPHDFVTRPGAQKMIYGGMVDQIKGNKHPLVG
ncbi:aldo/keto reductase [Lewinella cohaerens]|uniref:aldo/keto reductase n=1 Tax=Lewinella cohaerens TaxID=70995 RepID=UPI000382C739|nr:aldo/keto reductase [Lewinella cohaerens]